MGLGSSWCLSIKHLVVSWRCMGNVHNDVSSVSFLARVLQRSCALEFSFQVAPVNVDVIGLGQDPLRRTYRQKQARLATWAFHSYSSWQSHKFNIYHWFWDWHDQGRWEPVVCIQGFSRTLCPFAPCYYQMVKFCWCLLLLIVSCKAVLLFIGHKNSNEAYIWTSCNTCFFFVPLCQIWWIILGLLQDLAPSPSWRPLLLVQT